MTTMLIGETRFRLIRFDRDWRGIEEDEMLGKKRAIGKMLPRLAKKNRKLRLRSRGWRSSIHPPQKMNYASFY